ncbi:branched-chain amino acid ABC transporter permease [Siccirubricoccus sp. KC 17139]|uniref:Branched-chain amino acid ABC transporter permease n=1 Tax=Siccirubricoccus soli TaxID=2899147 RepID=A0ABT1DC92_9PROT|nr:branched-chain amino acid ABC transporter permease [Siccirubricoccus soli]MCO6419558.1 branched-chain amino acid ABC transporter permease [Siccirubricoccus soli]MCP2685693.1 branched-chain amino acid ABC transporter permease [Siccirubricoccus soli]
MSGQASRTGAGRLAPPGSRHRLELALAIGGALALILVAWAVPWLRFILTIALAKGIAVLGILLLLRAGQVSFGHAMFLATGAYTVAFLAPSVPEVLILVPLGGAIALGLGLVVGLFVVRYRDIFFGMLNLALSMVLYSLLEKLYALTKGTDGIRVARLTFAGTEPPRETQEWLMFGLALGLALVFGLLVRAYLASPMGQALKGIKTRETRLEFMGVPARHVLLFAYGFSALMGGVGGTLVAMTSRHVTPLLAYWTSSGELVFIAILGGAGSALGPFLGATAFELVRVYAAAAVADAWQMILGAVLLAVILFAPGGVWGILSARLKGRAA